MRIDFELNPSESPDVRISPAQYLRSINLCLTDVAAHWAETNPEAARILADRSPTEQSLLTFKNLLQDQFPAAAVETSTPNLHRDLSELHQEQDESLHSYYQRARALMIKGGGRDRASDGSGDLSVPEATILDFVVKALVQGLSDSDIRQDTIRGLNTAGRSLGGIYNIADGSEQTKKQFATYLEDDRRRKKLQFYEEIVPERSRGNQNGFGSDNSRPQMPYQYQQHAPPNTQWPNQDPSALQNRSQLPSRTTPSHCQYLRRTQCSPVPAPLNCSPRLLLAMQSSLPWPAINVAYLL